jgi:hypothetical protein
MADNSLPEIAMDFDFPDSDPTHQLYRTIARHAIQKIVPSHFWSSSNLSSEALKDLRREFLESLPLFSWVETNEQMPRNISFFLISKYRQNAFKFFFDMIGNWLVPERRLNIVLFYAVDFRIPPLGQELYTLCEVMVRIESEKELEIVVRNLPNLSTEICLGVKSSYYARRILDIKGLSVDEKMMNIQDFLNRLVRRFPDYFSHDIYNEMQHVMIICSDPFKAIRMYKHLCRIIMVQYLFGRVLREAVKIAPKRRHLTLKIFRAKFRQSHIPKKVLAVYAGVNFLSENELFEEKHLLKAIQNYLPDVKPVEESFFLNQPNNENICTVYLEVEKLDGSDFSTEEILRLRRELPNDLKDRIEHLMHPIFMPRNEEEVMRNILSLSAQLNYLRDIPQVFITFDEQAQAHLFFTIILVRILKSNEGEKSIEELFHESHTFLEYIHDFSRPVGYLRKKHIKEATVFRVKLSKNMFLRGDHSIDLCKARQVVVEELQRILGQIRDYNGGMISKQNELLCHVRNHLSEAGTYNDFLLENFFYSLTPVIMRSILEPHALKTLFLLMLDNLEKRWFDSEAYHLKMQRELDTVYVMITSRNPRIKDEMCRALFGLNIPSSELATVCVNASDTPCLGYIYKCDDPYKQEHFCQVLKHALEGGVLIPL